MSKHSEKHFQHQFDLISNIVRRNFILQYKGSFLGVLWSLLLPLSQLLVLAFLFQKVVPLGIEAYPAFVFAALLPWNWFSNSMTSASNLFLSNRDLVRHPNFTPSSLMVINVLTNLITFLTSLPFLLAILVFYGRGLTVSLLFFPLVIMIQGVLMVGLGLMIAIANVFYRDVSHLVTVAVMLLFYITPVFYQSRSVHESYQFLFTWNPMVALIQSYRAVFFFGVSPDWSSLLHTAVFSAMFCGLGYLVYQTQFHKVVDSI